MLSWTGDIDKNVYANSYKSNKCIAKSISLLFWFCSYWKATQNRNPGLQSRRCVPQLAVKIQKSQSGAGQLSDSWLLLLNTMMEETTIIESLKHLILLIIFVTALLTSVLTEFCSKKWNSHKNWSPEAPFLRCFRSHLTCSLR